MDQPLQHVASAQFDQQHVADRVGTTIRSASDPSRINNVSGSWGKGHTATGSATQTSSFDSSGTGLGGSDRLISSTWGTSTGTYAYDALGRATTVPSVDTGTGGSTTPGAVTSVYRSDNQISSLTQASATQTFTYDPTGSVLTATVSGSGSGLTAGTTTNYSDGSGGPSWTLNPSGTTTSYLSSMTSDNLLDVTTGTGVTGNCLGSATAQCTLNLTDLRGNVVGTALPASGTSSVSGYSEQTEFGQPRSLTTQQSVAACYGWLGTHQKQENNLSGLVLMGVRVYNPATGTFTESDAVLGGNANPYTYPGDPVNGSDLTGKFHICWLWCSDNPTVPTLMKQHWRGVVAGAELIGVIGCGVATGGACALVASVSFVVDSAISLHDNRWRFDSKFFKGEVGVAAENLALGIPGRFTKAAFGSAAIPFTKLQKKFTNELVNMPSMIAQWATHK